LAGAAAAALLATPTAAAERLFQIAPQNLSSALTAFGVQSGASIVFRKDATRRLRTVGAVGMFEPEEALARLLSGSELTYVRTDSGFAVVRAPAQAPVRTVSAPVAAVSSPAPKAPVVIEEIVVTATRQEEVLRKVPISVAAYTRTTLDAQGIREIDDVARATPGLVFSGSLYGNGALSNIAVRGVTSTVGAATTAIYIDDTPIHVRTVGFTASNAYPKIFDLARVEVLRGPQGTLFGASAMGGAVRFITPEPDLQRRSFYGRAELSKIRSGGLAGEVGAAVGGPIMKDRLGFRVSAWRRRDGGWVDHLDPDGRSLEPDSNASDSLVVRGSLMAQPAEGLTIIPSLHYQHAASSDTSVLWENLSDVPRGRFAQGNQLQQPTRDFFILPALVVRYDLGPVTLESSTSLYRRKSVAVWDYSDEIGSIFAGTPYPHLIVPGYRVRATMINRQENLTQELRVRSTDPEGRLRWIGGVFYAHQDQDSEQWDYDPDFPELMFRVYGRSIPELFGPTARTDTPFDLVNLNRGVDTQFAAFGQADLMLSKGVTLTAGLRASRSRFRSQTDQYGSAISENHTTGRQSETPVTSRVGLAWQIDDQNLVYATVSKGFRIGGTNPAQNPVACAADFRDLGITGNPLTYGSDSVWNYELGAKNSLMDGRLSIAASLFQVDWSDIQRNVGLPSCYLFYTANLGRARSRGFDLSIQAKPTERLALSFSAGFTDAEYRTTIRASSGAHIVERGDPLGERPWIIAAGAEYVIPSRRHEAYLRGDYFYRSAPPRDNPRVTDYDPLLPRLAEQHMVRARAGVRMGGVDLSVFVNNLLDSRPVTARARTSRTSPLFLTSTFQPRTFGVTMVARY
jgi:outer membrane receptor protein involved in Fe transport